ncbi:PHP domain-containing protein [Nocardioides sp. GCM10027113]|uniref:PHP domain-containing protein n=1 Tax=unclassified Nocardioides TaxID=2615069 RepID=UPI0036239096
MRIDLHTHSRASDGTDSPGDLVLAAARAGLDAVALTDHDTTEGWTEAAEVAAGCGIRLVRGLEISCRHAGRGVHLLAYLPDPTYPPLVAELERILAGRDSRVPAMVAALQALGIEIGHDDVARAAGHAVATGRPHVADALVTLGAVRDRTEAFARYLSAGRPAYVDRYASPLVEMLALVEAAGGVAVVAHPWGRHDRSTLDPETIASLAERGLAGLEVDHEDHDPDEREDLRGLARELGLVVTGSSDHHGTGKTGHDLGCNTTAPGELERLLDLARAAAERSGRTTPEVVNR